MSVLDFASAPVVAVESLMDAHFRTVPFHNLPMIYGDHLRSVLPGGTCSDMTLSFIGMAREAGVDVALHSGFIRGREIHRLARIHLEGRVFFADVGNGWPALKLYPADEEVSFRCFGMGFRTEVSARRVRVFHERRGAEHLQLEIDVRARPESEIRADIERRFSSGVEYPFSNSPRFALVVDERFLFLRGDRLEIYTDEGFECIAEIAEDQIPRILTTRFACELCEPLAHLRSLQESAPSVRSATQRDRRGAD